MAGRYGLNLRPLYGRDEQNPGDAFASGISSAIKQHMLEGEQDSQRRAAGQVKVKETGIRDRIGGVVQKVRGVFGAPDVQPTQPFNPNAMIAAGVPMPAPGPMAGATAPGLTPSYAPPPPAQHGLDAARPSIGAAIQPYEDQDTHGNTWKVDPLYGARVADAGRSIGDQDKIDALVRAGMPAAEAEARVKNNVVRYDETFGEGPRAGRGGGLTFEQRKKLQDDAIASRNRIAELTRGGRQNTEEYRQEMLKLRKHEADLREQEMGERGSRADVAQETTIAGAIDRTIPKDPITQATATEQQKADYAKRGTQRDAHLKNAEQGLQQRKNAKASREQVQARAQALQRQGKTREQIAAQLRAEGYKVQ